MSNLATMTEHQFESKKNMRAGSYTALVCGLLLVIFLFVKWGMPPLPPPPPFDEGIEVNLGNSDIGSGNDQPMQPNPPAPSEQQAYAPPKAAVAKEEVKDIETDDKDEEAPVIKKPPVAKPEATKVPEKEVVKAKPVTNPKPAETPAPPAPKPKAQMKAISGEGSNGGNDASTYKRGSGEGIAGGRGDQGRPGGNPDSKNYTGGGTGTSGMRIKSGLSGRSITRAYKYQDDFNENATVAVDVKIDKNGNVVSASYQLRGSTTSDSYYKEKAVESVRKSKFNASPNGPDEQTGTVLVNFRVRG
jgi:hypothetical protein